MIVFRASQPLNNEFNVYIDGKAVPVSNALIYNLICDNF